MSNPWSFRGLLILLGMFSIACEPLANKTDDTQDYIATAQGNAIREDLSPKIEKLLAEHGLPSVTVVAFDSQRVIWAEAFGDANIGQKARANLDTVYNTASTFKIIVATSIMQLVEKGLINLDDPINLHLSEPIADFTEQGHPLTIRHMLAHHSGLENAEQISDIDIWSRRPVPTLKQQISQIKSASLPGEQYAYCNACFLLWADLIENVTGQDLEPYVRDNILLPVGSKTTDFGYIDATMTEMLAMPYQQIGGRSYPIAQKFLDNWQAGDTYMRPLDMASFLQIHLNGEKNQPQTVLSQTSIEEMRQPQFMSDYTLGFLSSFEDNIQVLSWDGGVYGGSTMYELEPDNNIGVYIVSNSHNTQHHLHDIAKRIRDLMRNEVEPYDYSIETVAKIAPLTATREELSAYTGVFEIEGVGVQLSVNPLNNGLALTNPAGKRLRIVMLDDKEGRLVGTDEGISFDLDKSGRIDGLTLVSGESSFSARRVRD